MRRIVASEFITLDGVMEAPGPGDTTLPEKRGWSQPFTNQQVFQTIMETMGRSDAMLLGRRTYVDFAAFWSAQPANNFLAQRMNNVTKYVASTTLDSADWSNSTLIRENVADALARLKQQPGQDISVIGSGTLVNWLIANNLLDELQLMLCPVVLGVGKRLFQDGNSSTLELVTSKVFDTGMVLLTYKPVSAQ